jgi:hypothetical protein
MPPATAPAIPKGRILPQKESTLFKTLLVSTALDWQLLYL